MKRLFIGGGLLVGILLIFYFFFFGISPDASSKIDDLYLEKVKVGDSTYIFDHGTVLSSDRTAVYGNNRKHVRRLIAFYAIVREDPILSTARDQDIDSLKNSIKNVETKKKELEKNYGGSLPFYPTDFLSSVVDTSIAEREFLQNVSDQNAEKLLKAYKKSADVYTETTGYFMAQVKKNKTKANVVLLGVPVDTQEYLRNTTLLEKNYQALEGEIKRREQCLSKGYCWRPMESFKNRGDISSFAKPVDKLLPLDELYPEKSKEELAKLEGPFLVRSACWGWGPNFSIPKKQIYILPSQSIELNGLWLDRFKLATDNFYRMSSKTKPPEWFNRGDTQAYVCTTNEYQFQAVTMKKFQMLHKSKPLLKNNKLEGEILSGKNKDWDAYLYLADKYAYEYSKTEDENLRSEMVNRYLEIKGENNNIDSVYNTTSQTMDWNKNLVKDTVKERVLTTFMFFRTYWDIFYLPYSRNFWRIDQPEFFEKAIVKGMNFKNQKEMLKTMTKEQLKNIIIRTRKGHENAWEERQKTFD